MAENHATKYQSYKQCLDRSAGVASITSMGYGFVDPGCEARCPGVVGSQDRRGVAAVAAPVGIVGLHHFNFTVEDLDRTVDFYTNLLGFELRSRGTYHGDPDVVKAFLGDLHKGETKEGLNAEIAVLELTGTRVEFMQWLTPKTAPYHGDVSIAGAAHLGIRVKSILEVRAALEEAGVLFPTPIELFAEVGHGPWQECAFRDPDGIVVELIQDRPVTDLVEVLGSRVRKARLARGLTLKQTASLSEISTAHLSQVERGDAIPSLPALVAISATLGVAAEYFLRLEGDYPGGEKATLTSMQPPASRTAVGASENVRVVTPGDGRALSVTGGVEWRWLTEPGEPIRVVQAHYDVGAVSEDLGLGQDGTETWVILEGSLEIELEGHPRALQPGSSITYDRTARRRFTNVGTVPVVAIWVIADRTPVKSGESGF
jgi:catechol 2,3-dioxygenase-like lactoylglutathione lyase family enzyme/transcriptional regulator with XRE-family HTH domain/mannose-6-phosphate isomerase-like protein (cupin superfamily)